MHLPRLARMTATCLGAVSLFGISACSQPAEDDANADSAAATDTPATKPTDAASESVPQSTSEESEARTPEEKQAIEEARRYLLTSNELTKDMLDALDMHKAGDDAAGEKLTNTMAETGTFINESVCSDMVDDTRPTDASQMDPALIDWDQVDSTIGGTRERTEKSLELLPDAKLDFEQDGEDTGQIKLPLERLDMKKEDGEWKVCDARATGDVV